MRSTCSKLTVSQMKNGKNSVPNYKKKMFLATMYFFLPNGSLIHQDLFRSMSNKSYLAFKNKTHCFCTLN